MKSVLHNFFKNSFVITPLSSGLGFKCIFIINNGDSNRFKYEFKKRETEDEKYKRINARRVFLIEKEELEILLNCGNSYIKIGKMYGVSDNTVRKRAIQLGLKK